MIDFKANIKKYINSEIQALNALNIDDLNAAINAILDTRNSGNVIYTMGNGGSSATASHMVCDFAKGATEELGSPKFLFECLSDNTPIITAIANDISYDDIFSFQLEGKLKKDDLIIAISGSGNSKNIIKAVEYAKTVGTKVIGVTGYSGGKLKDIADYHMHVNINDMQIAEDIHMMFDHMMMRVLGES